MNILIVTSPDELWKRLVLLRVNKEVTLTQAAKGMGISQGALSDYERGAKLPGYKAIQRIVRYYGVSYDYLFGETDEQFIFPKEDN